jgi:hypothetical protein
LGSGCRSNLFQGRTGQTVAEFVGGVGDIAWRTRCHLRLLVPVQSGAPGSSVALPLDLVPTEISHFLSV